MTEASDEFEEEAADVPAIAVPETAEPPPGPVTLTTEFEGRRGRLFWLALKTSIMTVLTLGFYRFWMKTRLRRYYWSSVRPGGVPLEYVGEPLEKLLGFLIAVAFLAFYIGIANLILMFFSFSVLNGAFAAYALSFVGVIPILFYARYRARRYVLARTRWRGLRFGLEPGAWGYAWRALVHWGLAIVTLGLLWPRKTFWLEKYLTDRTYFGSARMHQGGAWTMLFWPFVPVLQGVIVTVVSIYLASTTNEGAAIGVALGLPLTFYGWANYRVQSMRRLTSTKTIGDAVLNSQARHWRIIWIYFFGNVLILLALLLLLFVAAFAAVILASGLRGTGLDYFAILQALQGMSTGPKAALAVGTYFSFFILWVVLTNIFLTMPLSRHYAETLSLTGAATLNNIRQRDRDRFAEAEGFAEALDVGAAI